MLRWLTAGESHGPALVAVLEGLPAGVPVTSSDIATQLARRRLGYGRGARMKFEQDQVTLLGGVRHGVSHGWSVRRADRQHRVAEVGADHGPRPGRTTAASLRRPGPQRPADPAAARVTPTWPACRSTASTTPARCWSGPPPGRPPPGSRSAPSPSSSCARCSAPRWSRTWCRSVRATPSTARCRPRTTGTPSTPRRCARCTRTRRPR